MRIEVNGETMEIGASDVAGLIAELGYAEMICAVAVNGGFVARADHPITGLNENDRIEIVAPMKGG